MALSSFSFTSAAAFLVGGMASAILSAVHAQGFDMAGAHSSETLIFAEPLEEDALAASLGRMERDGQSVNHGLGSSALTRSAYLRLPSAPELGGLSGRSFAAVNTVLNDVVPQIATYLLGADAPISPTITGPALLFPEFSFLPTPGRP